MSAMRVPRVLRVCACAWAFSCWLPEFTAHHRAELLGHRSSTRGLRSRHYCHPTMVWVHSDIELVLCCGLPQICITSTFEVAGRSAMRVLRGVVRVKQASGILALEVASRLAMRVLRTFLSLCFLLQAARIHSTSNLSELPGV